MTQEQRHLVESTVKQAFTHWVQSDLTMDSVERFYFLRGVLYQACIELHINIMEAEAELIDACRQLAIVGVLA